MKSQSLIRFCGLAGLIGGLLFLLDFTLVGWLARGGRLSFFGDRLALARSLHWIIVSLLLAAAAVGPLLAGATGTGRLRRLGGAGALLTLAGLAAYIAGSLYLGLFPDRLTGQFFTPAGSVLISLGMILQTLSVVAAGRWRNWRRFATVPAALYFPLQLPLQIVFFLGAGRGPNPYLLGLWGIGWMLLGAAVWSSAPDGRAIGAADAELRPVPTNG